MAQRAIPLVADLDPVEVIYEDEDMIAVNKPAGVISAPKHRFTVSEALVPSFSCACSGHMYGAPALPHSSCTYLAHHELKSVLIVIVVTSIASSI